MDRAELEQFAYRTSVENDELKMRIRDYEEQLMTAKRKKFVQKSEPTPDQLSFFNEAESEANPEQPEPALEKVRPSRKTNEVTITADAPASRNSDALASVIPPPTCNPPG